MDGPCAWAQQLAQLTGSMVCSSMSSCCRALHKSMVFFVSEEHVCTCWEPVPGRAFMAAMINTAIVQRALSGNPSSTRYGMCELSFIAAFTGIVQYRDVLFVSSTEGAGVAELSGTAQQPRVPVHACQVASCGCQHTSSCRSRQSSVP